MLGQGIVPMTQSSGTSSAYLIMGMSGLGKGQASMKKCSLKQVFIRQSISYSRKRSLKKSGKTK